MEYVAIVTTLLLAQCFWFAFSVGKMRAKHGVKAPAMDGPDEFLCAFRVHQNTLEQLVLVLPAMWIFAMYMHAIGAAVLGGVFLLTRFMYSSAYMKDPKSRSTGFSLGFLAMIILLVGGLAGAVLDLVNS